MSEKATHDHLLGSTARWTAEVRARESLREDRLFNDPWAAALAGEEEANYGRWSYPVIPRMIPDMPRSWFVTAQKQAPNS